MKFLSNIVHAFLVSSAGLAGADALGVTSVEL
jgi:hypothetical protein